MTDAQKRLDEILNGLIESVYYYRKAKQEYNEAYDLREDDWIDKEPTLRFNISKAVSKIIDHAEELANSKNF